MESTQKISFSKKEAISFGFKTAKENIFFFIALFIIWVLIAVITSVIQRTLDGEKQYLISFVFNILSLVINSVLSLGIVSIMLRLVDGKKAEFKDLYYTTKLFNFILASLIRTVITLVGFLLFIIPGIIFSIKFQYVEYFIVDKKMDAIDAIKASWEITKGVKWNLFLFGFLLGIINILGLFCIVVGLFITVPLTMVANAFVFRKLLNQTSLK